MKRTLFDEIAEGFLVVAATLDVRHLKGIVPKPAKPFSIEAMNRPARAGSGK